MADLNRKITKNSRLGILPRDPTGSHGSGASECAPGATFTRQGSGGQ